MRALWLVSGSTVSAQKVVGSRVDVPLQYFEMVLDTTDTLIRTQAEVLVEGALDMAAITGVEILLLCAPDVCEAFGLSGENGGWVPGGTGLWLTPVSESSTLRMAAQWAKAVA